MAQWRVPPDHIVNNWSESLLLLMFEKLTERLKREADATRGATAGSKPVQMTARALRKMEAKQHGN